MSRHLLEQAGGSFDTLVAGSLGAIPEEEEDARRALLKVVVGGAAASEVGRGEEILARYGYDEELSLRRKRLLAPAFLHWRRLWLLTAPLFFLLPSLVLIGVQLPLFRCLQEATESLRRGLNGSAERIEVPAHGGVFSEFLGRLDQLIRKLDSSLEKNVRIQENLRENLADISHQLKTPIAAISLYSDLLAAEIPSRGEGADLLRRSSGAVTKLETLTRDLLKLTRLEAGSITFKREAVDLRSLVAEAWTELQPLAQERSFFIEEERGRAIVYGDRAWLREAVGNVLKNAVQQTRADGRIRISIVSNPLFRRMVIADDGGGIPAEDLPRVFERFFSRSNAPDMERTGIGLSLAREIVRGNRGELRAWNGREGAEFIFSFYD